ncbi:MULTISPECIES: peroxiredoxin family protein [Anoxybacillaceae]|uniref:Alkyl hydroperoxide reductase subunit C/ Thiol specific antioxidant domain-containing protein n=2 Tax=Anoxybacillaceae TaxID=3120669 RepID=A0A023DJK8_9BACL|nr:MULTISPECIES: TlpA disulfide reductase family protein [Bacillaceae]ANB58747.1 thioredoxin family protein [Anoxybacillus sp. B2M1]ANB64638.1 thioredoxin family protein [Anoxybacillus sp. B7M1]MBB3854069.1 peroxiredoxin [Parageobacillus caldoxylosilyticus]MBB3907373.1 peroxiredoxin [Anoxybacillus rupiensis]MED5053777.1 TlpA disulfide reductase family protein [Anoxybacillus rupiensis]
MQFGSIIVQGENLLLISGLLISYVMFYYGIRILKIERNIMDLIFNSFINGVLIWKFSYVVLHPNSVLQNPMTIIYFNGGYVGIGIGIIFITISTWLSIKKQNISLVSYTRAAVPAYLGYFSTFVWIRVMEDPQNHLIILQAIVAVCFFIAASRINTQKTLLQLLIWFHLIQFEIALYKNNFVYAEIISKEVLLYVSLIIIFLCILYWSERQGREEATKDEEKGWRNTTNNIILGGIFLSLAITPMLTNQHETGRIESPKTVMSTSLDSGKIGTNKGQFAPDFELLSITGNKVKLSDLRGKTVILNFWATWCPPCRAEIPEMQKFYENNKNNNVEILAVNLTNSESSPDTVKDFVRDKGMTFNILLDKQGKIGNLYGIITIPTSYIIDKNGIIREKHVGPMSYETMDNFISSIK